MTSENVDTLSTDEILEEKTLPHINVVICTPGHSVMTGYLKSLLETANMLNENGISWAFSSEFSSHVGDAREMTLNGGSQNEILNTKPFKGNITYDKIFWIDSDISWTTEDFMKIYNSDKDIISGAYLLGSGEVTAYPEALGMPLLYQEVMDMTELRKVHSVGFGFVAMKSGIFEKMPRPWFQANSITTSVLGEDYTFNIMGEDISWCHKANNLGYEVWLDPTVKVTHHKTVKLTWEGIKP